MRVSICTLVEFLGQMVPMTPEQMQVFRWEREIDERNRPLTDDELDAILTKDSCIKCFNTCSQAEADNSKMVVTWFCPFSYTTQIF